MSEQGTDDPSGEQASGSENASGERAVEPNSAPAPHHKQLRYWNLDLVFKLLSLLISVFGFIFIIAGIRANYQQVAINTEQLRINTEQAKRTEKSMCANVQVSVVGLVTDLDKIFMERPHLRPYFYESVKIDSGDARYAEVSAAAEMVLDIFDLVADQSRDYPECWKPAKAWDAWIVETFSTSPILMETYDANADWYGETLINMRKEGEKKAQQAKAQGG